MPLTPMTVLDTPATFAPKQAGLQGKKILVVDDNLINLEVAVEAFSMAGAKVDSTSEGAEAITLIERNAYDLLLLDLFMPGIDGLEVGQAARASTTNGSVRMLIFTASDKEEANRAMQDLKANGVIGKPVEIDDMLKKAEELFES
jgi:CheY-like chemotaxis protein